MLVAGGQVDQPDNWWDDMDQCDAIYNTLEDQARAKKKQIEDAKG